MSKTHGQDGDHPGFDPTWALIAFCAVVIILVGVVCMAPVDADAASVQIGYDHGFGGSQDPTFPKPIDHSTLWFDFTGSVGTVQAGAEAEMFQNGRAGLASDKFGLHVGRPFKIGPVTFTPTSELGYARAPNYDYAYWGAKAAASIALGPITTELSIRRRQSMAENYFPNLKGSDLPTTKWRETRYAVAPVWQISQHVGIGLEGDIDQGSNPDKVLGVFTRLSF